MTEEWIKSAKVGDKVVCTYDMTNNRIAKIFIENGVTIPSLDQVYTIRTIHRAPLDGVPCFRFSEIVNPHIQTILENEEPSWDYQFFKPLVSEPKGMETLRGILKNPQSVIKPTIHEVMTTRVMPLKRSLNPTSKACLKEKVRLF